jgi:hypothetical protein
MRASAVAAVLIGCGAGAKPSAAPAPTLATTDPASEPAVLGPVRAPGPASSIRLELEPAAVTPAAGVRVELLAPVFGELLPALGLAREEVRVSIEPATLPTGTSVVISFDGLRPRPLPASGSLLLGELYPEDRVILPGIHTVVAVAIDAQGKPLVEARSNLPKPFAIVDFFVGERSGRFPKPEEARLFCLSPSGTFHGADAERPLLQFLSVGNVGADLPLRVDAEGAVFEGKVDPANSYRIAGLPAGDVRVRAGSSNAAGAECVSTLNPERRSGP